MTMLLTGLTRDGVFLVENGEIAGAVNNFRFNMSPLDVLRQASRRRRDGAGAVPRVERLVHPRGDAADGGRGLQHVVGLEGAVTAATGRAR